jgi:SAM-dependent methyltransferase
VAEVIAKQRRIPRSVQAGGAGRLVPLVVVGSRMVSRLESVGAEPSLFASASASRSAGAPVAESGFERRERERLRAKIAVYERIAEWRQRRIPERHYYSQELRRLVASLTLPDSRILEVGCGLGDLLASLGGSRSVGLDVCPRMIEIARQRHPSLELYVADVERDPLPEGPFDVIVLSDAVGHLDDIQRGLERLGALLAPGGRLIITYYSFLWEPALKLAERLGLKTPWPEQNWLSMKDIANLLRLADFEVVRRGTDILLPVGVPVLADLANRVIAKVPGLREGSLVDYFVARPVVRPAVAPLPSVSVICPCKNEKGNIREAVARTPVMGPATELVFVDGNSTDGTREEIEATIRDYRGPLTLRLVDQGKGKGKGDAVRRGFTAAKNDVLMILDSDLTVPPEDLPKFYRALVTGKGEFINGVRLVYPMEGEAMRFLNLLGNKFFSTALSWLLEQPIKDSLCGTKVLYRRDYQRIADNRAFFGDFDPFGDFDLLFGAARLNLKIVDLPVRYRARTYGDTKISRFQNGWMLLKMTAFGFKKLRMGL